MGYACQGIEYAVEGRVFDPLITFNVVWRAEAETCHSITSWTGTIEGDVIETQWSLVRWSDPDRRPELEVWAGLTGSAGLNAGSDRADVRRLRFALSRSLLYCRPTHKGPISWTR
ncbi:hypothetical protein HXX25_06465 [Hyphobacterium sp. CCMP332]|uniref:hypothetical protein n=1 Tax=Hyphobacterium sp. CCMP332 TaxID=2749086 RepID=UPI00164F41CA|nr:hypothetical protein HXX25_06465 [Hyphobacterium sp. CCMP332]